MSTLNIVILSRLPSGYAEKHLLANCIERGHSAEIIKFTKISLLINGEQSNSVIYGENSLSNVDVVIPRLYGGPGDYGISVLRQFELMGVYTPNKSIAISRANQTVRAMQIMSSKGIALPKMIIARGTDDLASRIDALQIPFLLQRTSDRDANQMLVESKRTANAMLSVLGSSNDIFIAQEFDTIAQKTVYKALIIGKTVSASLKVNKISDSPLKALPYPLTTEQLKVVNKTVKSMGLAICEIDIIDGRSGPEVIRVSANPDIEFYEKNTTRDVTAKMIEYIERNAKQRNKKDRIGA